MRASQRKELTKDHDHGTSDILQDFTAYEKILISLDVFGWDLILQAGNKS
jgi:hypothetical protein